MKKMNKKGFTLIELLAVIVVLAIIMVIATQQVNSAMANARANSFVESYQMIVKQVKNNIAMETEVDCEKSACNSAYELSDDYDLIIQKEEDVYTIYFAANGVLGEDNDGTITFGGTLTDGKFSNVNLGKYGSYNTNEKCSYTKISSNATSCGKNYIQGSIEF